MINTLNKIVIIGAGPAGLSLSASLKIAGIEHIILEKSDKPGGQIAYINNQLDDLIIGNIENGKELVSKFIEFTIKHELPVEYNCAVRRVDPVSKSIYFVNNGIEFEIQYYKLIIASGARLNYEKSFFGLGFDDDIYHRISGRINDFKGVKVGVIGSGDNALIAALKLSEIAEKVILLNRKSNWKARKDLLEKVSLSENIEILTDSILESLQVGGNHKSLLISRFDDKLLIPIDKIVFKIGYKPNTEFLLSQIEITENGYLLCDENFCSSDKAIYGIGDVVASSLKRISIAIAHGTQLGSILNRDIL
jgi:thioredoxin reductase